MEWWSDGWRVAVTVGADLCCDPMKVLRSNRGIKPLLQLKTHYSGTLPQKPDLSPFSLFSITITIRIKIEGQPWNPWFLSPFLIPNS